MLRKTNWAIYNMNFFNFSSQKFEFLVYLGTLLNRCLEPKLSSLKFSPAFGILETLQGLTGAAKVSNLNLHATKLDTCLMKNYPIFSALKN